MHHDRYVVFLFWFWFTLLYFVLLFTCCIFVLLCCALLCLFWPFWLFFIACLPFACNRFNPTVWTHRSHLNRCRNSRWQQIISMLKSQTVPVNHIQRVLKTCVLSQSRVANVTAQAKFQQVVLANQYHCIKQDLSLSSDTYVKLKLLTTLEHFGATH